MGISVIEETEISFELDVEIKAGLCRCFPPDGAIFSKTRSWHGSGPAWSVIIEEDGKVPAHVGIVDRTILVSGDTRIRVAGIQNVFVLPEGRSKGFCDQIMNKAMSEADKRNFDCGLLFCVPEIEKIYSRCGWQLLPKERVIRVDENGNEVQLPEKNIAMFYPLIITEFPSGDIHLQGNDW